MLMDIHMSQLGGQEWVVVSEQSNGLEIVAVNL
jgi:hypothetical protein